MNQLENAIKKLKNKEKEINFWNILKDCFKDSFNVWKNGFKNYRNKKESINVQLKTLEKIYKSINSKKTKAIYENLIKENYKNFVLTIEYSYEEAKEFNITSLTEHYEKIIKSDEYQYLINYFKKEETFDIYKRICQKTKYFDFYELMKINSEEPFNNKEQSLFMENISKFINLINSHLPENLTEEDIIENFVNKIDSVEYVKTK